MKKYGYLFTDSALFCPSGDLLISNAMFAVSATFNVYTFCWPNHIDPYLHMNNSRFLREMDFGRYDFYLRTGRVVKVPFEDNKVS